jgi:hypothetical protein
MAALVSSSGGDDRGLQHCAPQHGQLRLQSRDVDLGGRLLVTYRYGIALPRVTRLLSMLWVPERWLHGA